MLLSTNQKRYYIEQLILNFFNPCNMNLKTKVPLGSFFKYACSKIDSDPSSKAIWNNMIENEKAGPN